jgi:putative acetyltransferase
MKPELIIRPETSADFDAISELTITAFATLEISNHTEQFIIEALRAAGALTVSLVAERNQRVIGHLACSPVAISDGSTGWYGLGPVSVLPELQRQGVGKALIAAGHARLKALGARGACLVGHPEYYRKFGYRCLPELCLEGIPPEFFMALPFVEPLPHGKASFHAAFLADH